MTCSPPLLAGGFPALPVMAELLQSGTLTAVDLVEHALRKIRELDGRLHAFVQVYADEAIVAAQAADRLRDAGFCLGPLHGIPVALKDNIDVRGRPSTAGSTLLADNIASRDAWITRRLLACGAVIIGKTHMVEFALGAWGANEYMGAPRNPWAQSGHYSPGGSSSGSAVAVAAGMVPLAIGTDTGASVRVPAALCGITGFKPTIGRLSNDGVVPLSTTLDSVGVMTQTALEASIAFNTLLGNASPEASFHAEKAGVEVLAGLRVAMLDDADLDGVQPEVLDAYRGAIETFARQGAHLRKLRLPVSLDGMADIQSTIMLSEAAASWGHLAADTSLKMDASVRPRILAGAKITAAQYVHACRRRAALKAEFSTQLDQVDVFVTPSSQWTARPLDSVDHGKPPVRYARIGNLLDLCGISVQLGADQDGLPIGLQIAGATNADHRVLQVAGAFQACTHWHKSRWGG